MGLLVNLARDCCSPACVTTIPDEPAAVRFAGFFDMTAASDSCTSILPTYDGNRYTIYSCNRPNWNYEPPSFYVDRVGYCATSAITPALGGVSWTAEKAPYLYLAFEDDRAAWYYGAVTTTVQSPSITFGAPNGCFGCDFKMMAVQLVFPKDGSPPLAAIYQNDVDNVTGTGSGGPLGRLGPGITTVTKPAWQYTLLDYWTEDHPTLSGKFANFWASHATRFAIYSCAEAEARDLDSEIWHPGTEGYTFGPVKDVGNTSATIVFSGGTGAYAGLNGSHAVPFIQSLHVPSFLGTVTSYGQLTQMYQHTYTKTVGGTPGSIQFVNLPTVWGEQAGTNRGTYLALGSVGVYLFYDHAAGAFSSTWTNLAGVPTAITGLPTLASFTFNPSTSAQLYWNRVATSWNSSLAWCNPTPGGSYNPIGSGCQYPRYRCTGFTEADL